MKKLVENLKYILVVPSTFDPDDLRRRRVLNSGLLSLLCIVVLLVGADSWDENFVLLMQDPESVRYYVVVIAFFMFFAILLVLNRSSRMPRNLVGWIFIVGMLFIVSTADSPYHLTSGRSIFVWAVPIALSVVVLPPASVFVVDLIITVVFIYFSGFQWNYFQSYTLAEIYIVSLVSWLGMSIAEHAIRDARRESQKNAAILEGVAEGVIVLGKNNQVVLANRAASELMRGEMYRILPMTESAKVNGRDLSFHWSQVEGVGWVAIVRDVSRQLEIDKAKNAILAVVSHEMRTPLAAILGFAEVLESRPVPGMATRIRANAQRLLKLVNDLLDIAQIQAGAFTIHKEIFSPSTLISYIQEHFLKSASEKGIVLDVSLSPALPEHIVGDAQRLEQVISNLVDNAIKFTEKGGRVDVSFCAANRIDWQIAVKDTGIGIPQERLPDIFEPFRRASDFATRKHQGVGLGLSIARKIVQLSGGDISAESTVGKGSTFTVTLPINANA